MRTTAAQLEKGLPASLDAERVVLGSILLDDDRYPDVAGTLTSDEFSIEKHRRIFKRMGDLYGRGEAIDRITVYTELQKAGEAESCDGLSYLSDLDNGLPQLPNVDAYVRIVAEKATLRRCIFEAQRLMNRCMIDEGDSSSIIAEAEAALQGLSRAPAVHGQWLQPTEVIERYPGGVNAFLCPPRGGGGISTPWPPLNELLAGLHPGELFVVAGRPSMGKSLVAMQMVHHAAKEGHASAIFSLEMTKESLVQRMICGIARIDSQKMRTGYLNQDERKRAIHATNELEGLPLYIDDTRARTVSAMTAALRKLTTKQRLKVIAIDHLQLMTSAGRRRSDQRNQELADILHSLKHEAGTMNATIILLSQLNRQCEIENRRPQLSDLAETGTIEQDADVVMFVHRWERYMKMRDREELRGLAEFIVAKQRSGPTGKRNMIFLDGIQRFECSADESGIGDLE